MKIIYKDWRDFFMDNPSRNTEQAYHMGLLMTANSRNVMAEIHQDAKTRKTEYFQEQPKNKINKKILFEEGFSGQF